MNNEMYVWTMRQHPLAEQNGIFIVYTNVRAMPWGVLKHMHFHSTLSLFCNLLTEG